MDPDDELCLCFHISWRKALNFIRIHRVRLPSQLADCGGAGTGCGWCRRQLERLTLAAQDAPPPAEAVDAWLKSNSPNKRVYEEGREKYKAALALKKNGIEQPPADPDEST